MSSGDYNQDSLSTRSASSGSRLFSLVVTIVAAVGVVNLVAEEPNAVQPKPGKSSAVETNLPTIEVAHAVMVTVELDFGTPVPRIAEALRQIERHSEADDGHGRTFAILDAYGEPTADGKLHISMHVSTEKPGIGALTFRRTGETLWKNKIIPAAQPPSSSFAGKNLLVMLDDGKGKSYMLDGSKSATAIMDVLVRDLGVPVRDFWPDGEEREVTMFYSACGCPVKAMARRAGDKTVRTKELPVIFPDDPAVATTISRLMGWQ
jgi:hypothetical protein